MSYPSHLPVLTNVSGGRETYAKGLTGKRLSVSAIRSVTFHELGRKATDREAESPKRISPEVGIDQPIALPVVILAVCEVPRPHQCFGDVGHLVRKWFWLDLAPPRRRRSLQIVNGCVRGCDSTAASPSVRKCYMKVRPDCSAQIRRPVTARHPPPLLVNVPRGLAA